MEIALVTTSEVTQFRELRETINEEEVRKPSFVQGGLTNVTSH